MIYLISISLLLFLLLLVTAVGRYITNFLPSDLRDSSEIYISPLLGLASIVLIATVYGWLSPFKTSLSLIVSAVLMFFCIIVEKQRTVLFRDWMIISAFAVIVTIPILAPAIRYDSFNPFNDTFTYLVHGQWLQEHAFSDVAKSSGFFPAETQVVLYQKAGHRMGGSFFLGFVQSLFNLQWSYYAYLPTVAVVFSLGSLAIGGCIRQVIPISNKTGFILSALPAFTMNGYIFGSQYGFLPQTFGITFSAGLACLVPGLIGYTLNAKPKLSKQFLVLIPLSIICSALLISYNDMFPIVGAGIGLFLAVVYYRHWNLKNQITVSILLLAVQVLAVVNIEGIRILRNFLHTVIGAASGAVHFGWMVLWSPIQFLAFSFGMKSPFDTNVFLIDKVVSIWIFPVFLILIMVILVKIFRSKHWNLSIILLLCINFVFIIAFLKFRYATQGVDGEIGNTFLQFKLSKWLAPFNLALIGIVIAWITVNAKSYKRILKYTAMAVLAAGMVIQYEITAPMFILQFQDETMRKYSPFNVFLELRSRIANISNDHIIYLGIPTEHHKLTQMVAYILSDRKLAGKYEDGYLRGSLPDHERDIPLETADWMIQFKPNPTYDENPLHRVGPFFIRKAPFTFYILESVKGAYDTETGDNKTWNWVKESVEYRYHFAGKGNASWTKVKFSFLLAGKPRTLFLESLTPSGKPLTSYEIPMEGGWGEYESPSIETNGAEEIVFRLKADGEPTRLSESDPREAKFLIQNFSIESISSGQ